MKSYCLYLALFLSSYPLSLPAQYITTEKTEAILQTLVERDMITAKAQSSILTILEERRQARLGYANKNRRNSLGEKSDISYEDGIYILTNHDRASSILRHIHNLYVDELKYRANVVAQLQLVHDAIAATTTQSPISYNYFQHVVDSLGTEFKEIIYRNASFALETKIISKEKAPENIEVILSSKLIYPIIDKPNGGLISPNRSVIAKHRSKSWRDFYEVGLLTPQTYEYGVQRIANTGTYTSIYDLILLAEDDSQIKERALVNNYRKIKFLKNWVKKDILSQTDFEQICTQMEKGKKFSSRFQYFQEMSNVKNYSLNIFKYEDPSIIFENIYKDLSLLSPLSDIEFVKIKNHKSNNPQIKIKINEQTIISPFTYRKSNNKIWHHLYYTKIALQIINNHLQSTDSKQLAYISSKQSKKYCGIILLTEAQKETILSYDGDNFIALP